MAMCKHSRQSPFVSRALPAVPAAAAATDAWAELPLSACLVKEVCDALKAMCQGVPFNREPMSLVSPGYSPNVSKGVSHSIMEQGFSDYSSTCEFMLNFCLPFNMLLFKFHEQLPEIEDNTNLLPCAR